MSTDKKLEKVEVEKPLSNEEILRKVAMEIVPLAVAAAINARGDSQPQRIVEARPRAKADCPDCGQDLRGCEGKHTLMVVYPQRYTEHGAFFPGYILNGVRYLSNDENHQVLVPANCQSEINGAVQRFEQNEQEMIVGRKKTHHSGSISPMGARTNPADAAWR